MAGAPRPEEHCLGALNEFEEGGPIGDGLLRQNVFRFIPVWPTLNKIASQSRVKWKLREAWYRMRTCLLM